MSSAPVEDGDFVSIDLSATVDGEDVPEAKTEGLSHEVGSGQLIEGLDEAIVGLKAGETKVFTTTLVAGEHAGEEAEVTVTVKSVKERELPEPDDEFAQLASEFDTIDELKASLDRSGRAGRSASSRPSRSATRRSRRCSSRSRCRCRRSIVQAQVDDTVHNAIHGLDHDEARFAEALEEQGSSREEFDADNRSNAEKAVKTQLLMDAIADELDVQVGQNDLTERLVLMSRQYGIEPQQLLQLLQQNNQLPAMFADVRRGLAVAAVVRRRHRHRHRRQRDRHHRVLRPADAEDDGRGADAEAAADERRRGRRRCRATPTTRPTTTPSEADDEASDDTK